MTASVGATPGLQLDGVVVRRGAFELRLSAVVPSGQVVALLGPNGAGKTTLLRALSGLERLHSGRLTLHGQLLDDGRAAVPAESRPVGLVFQDHRLFPHLDVLDNVGFAARSAGAGRAASRAVARQWIERLDLVDLAGRRPSQLSGGQAQRVALARALAAEPRLLLLDEPLAALDARTRLDVRSRLQQHLRAFDGPVLVVTHDPLEAMVLADRLLVIEDGGVVQDGSPAEVAHRPATDYVARLLGVNLFRGNASGPGETGVVGLDGGGTLVSSSRVTGRALVVLRPSSVTVHTTRPEGLSTRNVWPGTVTGLEPLGDRVRLQVDGAPPALVDVTPSAVAELALRPGTPVWLSAKATEVEAYPDPLAAASSPA